MSAEKRPLSFQGDVPYWGGPLVELSPQRSKLGKAAWFLGFGTAAASLAGGGLHWASDHPDKAAELLRDTVGIQATLELEGIKFAFDDKKTQIEERFFGIDENPFESSSIVVTNQPIPEPTPTTLTMSGSTNVYSEAQQFEAPPPKPQPMHLPEIRQLNSKPALNEGFWTIDNLPLTTESDVFMAKTFIRPDKSRDGSKVGILLVDGRRVNLNLVGGYADQVRGNTRATGKITKSDIDKTLVAFNGAFKQGHGAGGIVVEGFEYQPLVRGNATIAIMKDGTTKMGVWGEGELAEKTEDMVSIRQNAYLLVKDGEVTDDVLSSESNVDRWGRILEDSKEFVTWRSGLGITSDGDYLIATGNGLTPKTLAQALEAAGADTAMQLDINHKYLQTALFFHWSDGTTSSSRLMDNMVQPDNKYINPDSSSERDFFYMTLNEARYIP